MPYLDWAEETVFPIEAFESWFAQGSNICMDFHGDPANAELIFLRGGHRMVFKDRLGCFKVRAKGCQACFTQHPPWSYSQNDQIWGSPAREPCP